MEGSEKYRLPTEAEWEYAARGGTEKKSRYGPLDDIAWHKKNSGKRTHPVGGKAPNGFGLHDTLGNVAEWLQDWFGPYSRKEQTEPTGPAEGKIHVRRRHCGLGDRGGWIGKLGSLGASCRVEYRGVPRPLSIPAGPSSGTGVSFGLSVGAKSRGSDRGIGFRLLRTSP